MTKEQRRSVSILLRASRMGVGYILLGGQLPSWAGEKLGKMFRHYNRFPLEPYEVAQVHYLTNKLGRFEWSVGVQ